jgi:hypothetical protein
MDDRRPLVAISMSTTFMKQQSRSMSVRALVTVGPALDPAAFRGAESVAVLRSAPHDEVFRLGGP